MAFYFMAFIYIWAPGQYMNYSETIEFLFTRLPMFSRVGSIAYKKDLTNIQALCHFLNNPQQQFKSVHVAGTNGKGSTSHMLAAILQCAGYRTGLYTSPHLKDFRERIKINGEMVSEEFVVGFTERIRPLIDSLNPSFFEISVAMAFAYFDQEQVDIAVIETGLGGRLDSTNIIMPLVAVITNIEKDHTDMLGNTIAEIAFEKGGIIKPGIPVVLGEATPESYTMLNTIAADRGSALMLATDKRTCAGWRHEKKVLIAEIAEKGKADHRKYRLDLTGLYQVKNLITALESVSCLQRSGIRIEEEAIGKGLENTKALTGLHGRWETIHEEPAIILDVCHNEEGFRQCLQQVELEDPHQLFIILGMVKDKDFPAILRQLPQRAYYYFTEADIPRALPAEQLRQAAEELNLTGETSTDVNQALTLALSRAGKHDLILICGSVFLAGEVRLPVRELH